MRPCLQYAATRASAAAVHAPRSRANASALSPAASPACDSSACCSESRSATFWPSACCARARLNQPDGALSDRVRCAARKCAIAWSARDRIQIEHAGGIAHFGRFSARAHRLGQSTHRPASIAPVRSASCASRMRASMDFGRAAAHRFEVRLARQRRSPAHHAQFRRRPCARPALPGCTRAAWRSPALAALRSPRASIRAAPARATTRRIDASRQRAVEHLRARRIIAGAHVERRGEVARVTSLRVRGEHRLHLARAPRASFARGDSAHQRGRAPHVVGVSPPLAQQLHGLVGFARL